MLNVWNDSIWNDKKEEKQYDSAEKAMESFYAQLQAVKKAEINGVKLSYRSNQHQFSKDIMRAIRDRQILLVQAGVGIGKSIGYLIPIFSTFKNKDNFKNVIISTSSIGLQQQMLSDINMVSNMLNIDINATIVKGVNNYVCLNRLRDAIRNSNSQDKEILKKLEDEIRKKCTIDKDELSEVSAEIWKNIQLTNRGFCSNCNYSKSCLYRENLRNIRNSDIVITNHNFLARSVMDDRDFVNDTDMIVFDEAHKLEDAIRDINSGKLSFEDITRALNYYENNIFSNDERIIEYLEDTRRSIGTFYKIVKRRGLGFFYKNSDEGKKGNITTYDKIPFYIDKAEKELDDVIDRLNKIIRVISQKNRINGYRNDKRLNFLIRCSNLFTDMSYKDNSSYIYWADFFKSDRVTIGYASRNTSKVTERLFNKDIPIICTSGTLLDARGSYEYFKSGLSLNNINAKNRTMIEGKVYSSPYNYDEKTLFYYDDKMPNPKNNYDEYIRELPKKISELIRITNGRTLILFTSKCDRDYVYEKLTKEEFDFDIYKQEDSLSYKMLEMFKNNTKSCLLATGAFWEGIDVKGKSLSSVIIARLPFSNVNAISSGKSRAYTEDEAFRMVYLNDMVQKIAQGTGRLIRGRLDRGIISCLDSRFYSYMEEIKNATPFTNYTNNIDDVIDFSKSHITNMDGPRGPYKTKKKSVDI